MTFISTNFDEAVEAKPAAHGDYNLQITKCDVTQTGPNSKNPGSPQYKVTLGFTDEPNTPNITHYISLPNEGDEAGSAQFKTLLLKRFLVLFNVPFQSDGFDLEGLAMEMVGCSANVEVTMDDPDANGNVYNRIKVPRLRSEEGRGTPPRR